MKIYMTGINGCRNSSQNLFFLFYQEKGSLSVFPERIFIAKNKFLFTEERRYPMRVVAVDLEGKFYEFIKFLFILYWKHLLFWHFVIFHKKYFHFTISPIRQFTKSLLIPSQPEQKHLRQSPTVQEYGLRYNLSAKEFFPEELRVEK